MDFYSWQHVFHYITDRECWIFRGVSRYWKEIMSNHMRICITSLYPTLKLTLAKKCEDYAELWGYHDDTNIEGLLYLPESERVQIQGQVTDHTRLYLYMDTEKPLDSHSVSTLPGFHKIIMYDMVIDYYMDNYNLLYVYGIRCTLSAVYRKRLELAPRVNISLFAEKKRHLLLLLGQDHLPNNDERVLRWLSSEANTEQHTTELINYLRNQGNIHDMLSYYKRRKREASLV